MAKLKTFIKKESVLCVALLLAVVSAFFVAPSKAYFDYIDFRVLFLLFSLMLVVSGFQSAGTLSALSHALLRRVKTARGVVLCLVLLCFFAAMLITNDVALLTFVPLSVLLLKNAGLTALTARTVILQTIAANLGSMLTPIGNPQNLYLYAVSGMGLSEFIGTLLPYTVLSFLLLLVFCLFTKPVAVHALPQDASPLQKRTQLLCILLFAFCLLSVLRVVDSALAAVVVAAVFLLYDRRQLLRVDYGLLLTFVCFFIFIGNMGSIAPVRDFLQSFIRSREMLTGALLSQIISNVPAAVLLSAFTQNYKALLIGVNIGGLGTLIASLASLISYKLYAQSENAAPKRYMVQFTAYNLAFFLILAFSYVFLS